jgi:hypothetical protein
VFAQVRQHNSAFSVGKIDEGHLLTHDALEALRLLTNHRLDTESPFATVLLGQPTLAAKMQLGIIMSSRKLSCPFSCCSTTLFVETPPPPSLKEPAGLWVPIQPCDQSGVVGSPGHNSRYPMFGSGEIHSRHCLRLTLVVSLLHSMSDVARPQPIRRPARRYANHVFGD